MTTSLQRDWPCRATATDEIDSSEIRDASARSKRGSKQMCRKVGFADFPLEVRKGKLFHRVALIGRLAATVCVMCKNGIACGMRLSTETQVTRVGEEIGD